MPAGTPDRVIDEASGTADVSVAEGDILTDAEHSALDHTGITGVAGSTSPGSGSSGWTPGAIPVGQADGSLDEDPTDLFYDQTNTRLHVGPRGGSPLTGTVNVYGTLAMNGDILATKGSAFVVGTTDAFNFNMQANGTQRWQIVSVGGHLLPMGASNLLDLGATGSRVRTGHFGTSVLIHNGTTAQATLAATSLLFVAGADYTIGTTDAFNLRFRTAGTDQWNIQASGNLQPMAARNNAVDLGAPNARPRDIYAGRQFLAADGAVGTPAISFANDPNTGFYSAGADIVGVTAGGTAVASFRADRFALTDGIPLRTGTATGSRIGATATEKLAFWGATAVVQPAHIPDVTGTGGVVIDAEARATIDLILAQLAATGMQAAS